MVYFLYFENEKPVFSHHYDHYCNEFGSFFLLKGEPLGKGFDDTLTVGPYRSKLRAFSAYRRASGELLETSKKRTEKQHGKIIRD